MRPCKLRTVVRSYAPSKNDFLFERRLSDYLHAIIAGQGISDVCF